MADSIAVMDKGRVLQIGSPLEVYARPANLFVASFIGSPAMNLLKAAGPLPRGATTLRLGEASLAILPLAEAVAGEAVLGVRPEHVIVGDGPLKGEVALVEYMGARQILTVDSAAGRLKVRAPNAVVLRQGERVGLSFDPERVVVFDADSGEALRFAPKPVLREAAHG
jgi:multiple sugar transport system ATP-binding protein